VSAISTATAGAGRTQSGRGRVSGRQLAVGIGLSAAFAVVLYGVTTLVARTVAPRWAHGEGLTVLVVAEVYLAVIAGLIVAVGGPRGAARLLALRRPTARHLGLAFLAATAAAIAGIGITLAFSPLNGGAAATMRALVRAGSDESRLPAATALVWALIVVRLVALTGTAEELLFRGALYSWLRRRLHVATAICVTTAAFMAEHAYFPVLLPLVACVGLATGWVRHRTHTTVTTIVMHVCIDLALFLAAVALS
jgi:membrane protease YdiL (CAAX protease family)